MSTFKGLIIDFLSEEAKFTSLDNKKKQEELLNNTSVNLLWSMVLEKSRNQGRDQALEFYSSQSKAPRFDYRSVRKK